MTSQTPLQLAMAKAEINDSELARRIACSSQHINRARRGIKPVSPQMAQKIVTELAPHITLHQLRPDIYPAGGAA